LLCYNGLVFKFGKYLLPVQNLPSSHLLLKNLKDEVYKIDLRIFTLFCISVKQPLTLREECRMRVSENRVLMRISGTKRQDGENCIKRGFVIFTIHKILLVIKSRTIRWWGMYRVLRKILAGIAERNGQLGTPELRWEDNIKTELGRMWTEVNRLRISPVLCSSIKGVGFLGQLSDWQLFVRDSAAWS
jgi:hypothetical protein